MRIKNIVYEDFINYKEPSMFISTIECNGKCWKELNLPYSICQNIELSKAPIVTMDDKIIIEKYLSNDITKAIVFGGLEPMLQVEELCEFISKLRNDYKCNDTVIIYTGYRFEEIRPYVFLLASNFSNIIIKYGRYKINRESVYSDVLGLKLASDNQYAEYIDKYKDLCTNHIKIKSNFRVDMLRMLLTLYKTKCPANVNVFCMCEEFLLQKDGTCRGNIFTKSEDSTNIYSL